MSRTLKQVIYGSGYLMVFLIIILCVYAVWPKRSSPPPCDALCAAQKMQIDTSVAPQTFQDGADQSSVLVTLKNDSGIYGVTFNYTVTVDDVTGDQIDSFSGSSYIYSNSERYLIFTGIPSNPAEETVTVSTSELAWKPESEMQQYAVSVDPKSVITDVSANGGYVKGNISNSSQLTLPDVKVQALLYDSLDNLVEVSEQDLGQLNASSTEQFQVPFPATDERTASSIDPTNTEVFYEITQG